MTQPEADLMPPQRELDLATLVRRIWALRVPLLAVFLLVTAGYWGYWLATRDAPEAPTYSRLVQFDFDGAEEGRYPDGSPFHVGDLIAPNLVAALYDMHGLDQRGVDERVFAQAFAVERYSREYDYVSGRLDVLADRAQLGEFLMLWERLDAELRRIGAARLVFRPLQTLPLEDADVGKLLLDLPRLWARRMATTYGVLEWRFPGYFSTHFDDIDVGTLEYVAALAMVRRKAEAFVSSIDLALASPRAAVVQDPASGATLPTLRETVRSMIAGQIERLSADVVQLGLARDRATLTRVYAHRLAELTRAMQVAKNGMATIERTLAIATPTLEAGATPRSETSAVGALVDALLAREQEVARLTLELGAVKTMLESLERPADAEASLVPSPEDQLAAIVAGLREQAGAAERIRVLLGPGNFGVDGGFYRMADSGLMVSRPAVLRNKDVYVYLLLLFVVATVVVLAGVVLGNMPGADRRS